MTSLKSSLLLSAGAFLLVVSATTARADDWDDCRTDIPDKVMSGCTAVIDKHERGNDDLAAAHRRRGYWYSRRDMLERAMADFDSAVTLAPTSADALVDRAFMHRRRGNLDQAVADNARALELDPKHAGAYLQRGNLRGQRGEWVQALVDYDQSIALRPDNPNAYVGRASALLQTGNLDRAIADCDRAIAMNSNIADAFAYRAEAYRKKGELERTIADFSRAIAINPKAPGYFVARGVAYAARDEFDRAVADFDRALGIAPQHARAQELRRNALAAKTELGSKAGPPPAAAVAPGSNELSRIAAEAGTALKEKRYSAAIDALNRALTLKPDDPVLLRNRGYAYLQTGDRGASLKDLEASVAHKSDDGLAQAILGQAAAANGDKDKAHAAYSRAIELNPSDWSSLNNRSLILLGRGDYDAALADIERAIPLAPGQLTAQLFASRARHTRGRNSTIARSPNTTAPLPSARRFRAP